MESTLLEIQETVIKYADIISKIARVDVEVVDQNLFRVAGTGMFAQHVNETMVSEGYVYRQVLQTGRRQVIYAPGQEMICQSCPHCSVCREKIEISMPVRLGDEIIGIIGLVGSTYEQKDLILQQERLYMELLEQISDFIAVKAKEVAEMKAKTVLVDTLDYTIRHIEQGILILGSSGVITTANETAKDQLETEELVGRRIQIIPTGDHMNHQTEYRILLGEREFLVMGDMYDMHQMSRQYEKLVIFRNIMDVRKNYYELTNTTVRTQDCSNIIGSSQKTQKLKDEIGRIARSSSTVLITGESGTGKEMVATAVWNASDRRTGRFVAINCGAIPEALLESELFGYVKGAFTGADPNGRIGKFELANKGVIFLDEIGDMPLYLQVKLLRVLQERKITRIGSNQVIPIDVRVIAATNKDLKEMIREKKFREDLYYRLNVIPLQIAPLRERPEDIEDLAQVFAKRYAELFGKRLWKITEEVMKRLKACHWNGNVRELENTMEFMINMMGEDGVLDESTLPNDLRRQEAKQAQEKQETKRSFVPDEDEKNSNPVVPLAQLEQREIRRALSLYGNTTEGKRRAAKELGIGLATLYRKLEQLQS